jgi:hypothetical protein
VGKRGRRGRRRRWGWEQGRKERTGRGSLGDVLAVGDLEERVEL